jgi:hypothetical protein
MPRPPIADVIEVEQLLARYAVAMTQNDVETVVSEVFTPDVTYISFCTTYTLPDFPVLAAAFLKVPFPLWALVLDPVGDTGIGHPRLKGRSARVVVTMGMPALFYRWYYRGHSLKSLERNILRFCGIAPVRHTLIGLVEGSDARRRRWLARIQHLGERGR